MSAEAHATRMPAREMSPKKILLADDEPAVLKALDFILRSGGYWNLLHARDGIEVVIGAQVAKPDLIITDLMMPRVDGLSALRMLKQNHATEDIPIIVASGMEPGKLMESTHGKVDRVIQKPFTALQILSDVRELLVV